MRSTGVIFGDVVFAPSGEGVEITPVDDTDSGRPQVGALKRDPEATDDPLNQIDAAIGAMIQKERLRQNVSKDEFARKLRCTPDQIDDFEAGRRRVSSSWLFSICSALSVKPSYILNSLVKNSSTGETL